MGASLDSRDHRNAYVGYILHNLNALVVNLAPSGGIGDVAERRKIDVRNNLAARSRQNYDLVRSILCNPIKGIDKLRMILCRESEWSVVAVKFDNKHTAGISRKLQAAIGSQVVILKLHRILLSVLHSLRSSECVIARSAHGTHVATTRPPAARM